MNLRQIAKNIFPGGFFKIRFATNASPPPERETVNDFSHLFIKGFDCVKTQIGHIMKLRMKDLDPAHDEAYPVLYDETLSQLRTEIHNGAQGRKPGGYIATANWILKQEVEALGMTVESYLWGFGKYKPDETHAFMLNQIIDMRSDRTKKPEEECRQEVQAQLEKKVAHKNRKNLGTDYSFDQAVFELYEAETDALKIYFTTGMNPRLNF